MFDEKLPNHGLESQAMQCDKVGKYSTQKCWPGCFSMAALKCPPLDSPCPRGIVDEFGRKFHVGE